MSSKAYLNYATATFFRAIVTNFFTVAMKSNVTKLFSETTFQCFRVQAMRLNSYYKMLDNLSKHLKIMRFSG